MQSVTNQSNAMMQPTKKPMPMLGEKMRRFRDIWCKGSCRGNEGCWMISVPILFFARAAAVSSWKVFQVSQLPPSHPPTSYPPLPTAIKKFQISHQNVSQSLKSLFLWGWWPLVGRGRKKNLARTPEVPPLCPHLAKQGQFPQIPILCPNI